MSKQEFTVVGYYLQPVRLHLEASTAGEAYDVGEQRLRNGEGVELAGIWQKSFIVYDKDGDEVPEHELYELGD